ncbi:MAG TPA: RIP metalloprotease [Phenylobacterium sp.]|nr:RIP metalloprotease [Phenylobacterium sp.]
MDFLTAALTYILPFLFVLTIVVTIHEFGHFLTAKWCGVAIDRFSIGFGRAIASWRDRSGVEWRIGWMPLGGYVRFKGDDNAASLPDSSDLYALRRAIAETEGEAAVNRYFHFKPLWQRALVVAAGPIANFILAIVLFAAILMAFGERIIPARVDSVQAGSPAAAAGFKAGDVVVEAAGRRIDGFLDLQRIIMLRAGSPVEFVVQRGGGEVALIATPERRTITDEAGDTHRVGVLGVQISQRPGDLQLRRYGPIEAVGAGAERTWQVLDTTVGYLGRIVTGKENGDQLGGPLRIAKVSGDVAKISSSVEDVALAERMLAMFVALLSLTAVLSIGIGFMNLLPVPVLDGGHLLFYAYEAVARRPVSAVVQAAGYRIGLALLIGLMLFATWNDLTQLRVFQFFGGLLS